MAEAITIGRLPMPHGFFTRRGGVSSGPFASLNCSLSSSDDRDAVLNNRARVAAVLGADRTALLGLRQVHGTRVVTVTKPWAVGEGEAADAMVTDHTGLALGVVTADCAPVLFADPQRGVAGAAHAGWRGAVAGILEATVDAMAALGASAVNMIAVIGPCIAQQSYEVSQDLREAVLHRSKADARYFQTGQRDGHWQFDLAGYCASRLRQAGVAEVVVTGLDTLTDESRFFSHRRRTLANSGPIGHQMSAIMLA